MEIKKHLILTGTSTISWKDAIVKTIEEASNTLDQLSEVTVLKQHATINQNKIFEYFVDLDLAFVIDVSKIENKK